MKIQQLDIFHEESDNNVSKILARRNNRMPNPRRTKKMVEVEKKYPGQSLERLLANMITDEGLSATADYLGVSKATLGYWVLKLGIDVKRTALAPGDSLEVKRVG